MALRRLFANPNAGAQACRQPGTAAATAVPGPPPPAGWKIVDIGTLGAGRASGALEINDRGQVAGDSATTSSDDFYAPSHAFSWTRQAGMVDLGVLAAGSFSFPIGVNNRDEVLVESTTNGDEGNRGFVWTHQRGRVVLSNGGGNDSWANAINANGLVVGGNSVDYYEVHDALAWTPRGQVINIGKRIGLPTSQAAAVNNRGQVVGWARTDCTYPVGTCQELAFSWTRSQGMVDLGSLGGYAIYPEAVNDSGQVVGVSFGIAGHTSQDRAFSWTRQGGLADLGTLGGRRSEATATNVRGWVIGSSLTAEGRWHAFLWTPQNGMVDLGTLGGRTAVATGLNNRGEIVGYSTTANGARHAFSWTAGGGMVDLGTLGGNESVAAAVNNRGEVVGYSRTPGGDDHAVIWFPHGG